MKKLKQYLIAGLIAIIPAFLTVYALLFIFNFFDGILGGLVNNYLKSKLGFYIPGLGLVISLLIILTTGFIVTQFVGKRIFHILEKLFTELPLIKNIYPALKQLALFIFAQKEFGFQKVVLVEYPSKGIWSVGFLTNDRPKEVTSLLGKEMVAVFVPNSPGPLTGYVIFIEKSELRFPDISVPEAINIVLSGGIFMQEEKQDGK